MRETLGMKIKVARIRKQLTQYKLGLMVGEPAYSICRYETNKAIPSPDTLAKIKQALGLGASVN